MARIERIAAVPATVLIEGETGTGKELAARALHYLGERRGGPFVPINCGALPDTLVESELFGHVRGAFTDAREASAGLVAAAEGGTLFLDEVECLSPRGQAVLLRFLQDGTYRPIGGREERHSSARVVVASNRDLAGLIDSGTFRADLFFRLAAFGVRMPPLRERREDILILAEYFLARYAGRYGRERAHFDPASRTALQAHHWPGNVRELENAVHGAVVLADGPVIRVKVAPGGGAGAGACGRPLPPTRDGVMDDAAPVPAAGECVIHVPFDLSYQEAKAAVVNQFERAYVTHLMAATEGNLSRAARVCGKERSRLGRLLKKHALNRADFGSEPGRG